MMRNRRGRGSLGRTAMICAMLAAMTPLAAAQPQNQEPASCLLFPLFDSRDGATTVITVTNTNTSREDCGDGREAGDVLLHYQYIDSIAYVEFDRFEIMSPGDTLSVLSDFHNPEGGSGHLFVTAEFLVEGGSTYATSFDAIVGSAVVVDATRDSVYRYTPYAFQAIPVPEDPCGRPQTDADLDGAIDFDGIEYTRFPRELILDSFFEERGRFENELVIVTTVPAHYTAEVDFSILNNDGDLSTGVVSIISAWRGRLSDLSPAVGDLRGTPLPDLPSVETGWLSLSGRRFLDLSGRPVLDANGGIAIPPIVALYAERISGTDLSSGRILAQRGNLDGLELQPGNMDPQQNP